MLGRDTLKIFQRNLRHWEIGRSEVQNTFETVESAGTSNPRLLRVSGGEESLPSKIYEFLKLGRVESPLGREWERGKERGRRLW